MMLFEDNVLTVKFTDECKIPGYLVVRPKQKVSAIHELSTEHRDHLFAVIAKCDQIIRDVIEPVRVYTLAFCELDSDLHFHIFPRTKELGELYKKSHNSEGVNGPILFDWARKEFAAKPFGNFEDISIEIKDHFKSF